MEKAKLNLLPDNSHPNDPFNEKKNNSEAFDFVDIYIK